MTESQALPDESTPYELLAGMAAITVKVVQPSLSYQEYQTSTKQHNGGSLVIDILNSACRLSSRLRRSRILALCHRPQIPLFNIAS